MPMLATRIRHRLVWNFREFFGMSTSDKIYDDLSLDNTYDVTVNYVARVKSIRYSLSFVKNTYRKVLDIACGTGAVIEALLKKNISIVGIDISSGMLSKAKMRFKRYPNITFRKADVIEVKFSPSSFDLITFAHAIRFIPKGKEGQFAKNIAAWLTKEGTFIVILNELIYPPLQRLIYKFTEFPKGYNFNMTQTYYIINVLSPYLKLERKVHIQKHDFIFHDYALIFKKE